MGSNSTNLCFLLSLITLKLISAHSIFSNRHYGPPTHITKHLSFPNFNPNSTASLIKLLGSATVKTLNGHDRAIQIPDPSSPTPTVDQAGRAIYADPIRLLDPITKTPASFSTTFSFKIDAPGGGHGFAFVAVADEFTVGRAGPWLGMLNDACGAHEKLFAVEFDTGRDTELGDPSDDHVGVNIGGVVSVKTASASEARVSLRGGSVLRAWIDHDASRRRIEVRLGMESDPVPVRPLLDLHLDIAPFLQEYMFVGFSGSGGESSQSHNVLSWNFSSSIHGFLRLPSKKICPGNVAYQVSRYSESSNQNRNRNRPSSFAIFVAVIGLITASSIFIYFNTRSRSRDLSPVQLVLNEANRRPEPPIRPRRFTISEISRSTKRFSKTELVSRDCRGSMYRGTTQNGSFVSVKRFKTQIQNRNRVVNKIEAIVKLEHQKLAPIRGWCFEDRESIVVYNYYQNGTLEKWLYGVGALPWTLRYKLVTDVAESLSFLHSNGLAHGSLSAATVFVDSNHRAVLGDYGFGESGQIKSVSGNKSDIRTSSSIKQASKIIDPAMSDVFGFGALVVEMVAGKKTAGTDGGEGSIGILEFAWGLHEEGEVLKVVDERIGPGLDMDQAVRVVEIGLRCTLDMGLGRPSMEEVGLFLSMRRPIPKLPPSRPAELCP